jgi:hypothetical protein
MLSLNLGRFSFAFLAFALIHGGACLATTVELGYIQFVQGPDGTAGFNLLNETGPNSSVLPNTSFPVTTLVPFSDLTLYVNFADGTADVISSASTYFSAAGIGDQEPEFDSSINPVNSAILVGTFGATNLALSDGSDVTIDPDFEAVMFDFGNLQDNDFALITSSSVATPEPRLDLLIAAGLAAMIPRLRRLRQPRGTSEPSAIIPMGSPQA